MDVMDDEKKEEGEEDCASVRGKKEEEKDGERERKRERERHGQLTMNFRRHRQRP